MKVDYIISMGHTANRFRETCACLGIPVVATYDNPLLYRVLYTVDISEENLKPFNEMLRMDHINHQWSAALSQKNPFL